MIDMSEYLLYLQEQQVLICRSCGYCLQPNGIGKHFQRTHSAVSLKVRKELMGYAESLILRNPSEVVTPVTIVPAFDCLKVTQGFHCSTPGSIKEHCKTHRWTKPEGMSHHQIV